MKRKNTDRKKKAVVMPENRDTGNEEALKELTEYADSLETDLREALGRADDAERELSRMEKELRPVFFRGCAVQMLLGPGIHFAFMCIMKYVFGVTGMEDIFFSAGSLVNITGIIILLSLRGRTGTPVSEWGSLRSILQSIGEDDC